MMHPRSWCKGGLILPVLAAILLAPAQPALAQKPAAATGFDAFKLVRTRNIFDPDRRPPPSQNGGYASATPIARTDYVALTGTLVTGNKALAFFSGSRSDFDQVLPVNNKIAGATITKIAPGSVTIQQAGKTTTVAVGWTIPLNGATSALAPVPDALPAGTAPIGGVPAPVAAANPIVAAVPAGAASPPPAINEDVARMMRERRLQEMQ